MGLMDSRWLNEKGRNLKHASLKRHLPRGLILIVHGNFQVCASRLDPGFFVKTVMMRFNVYDVLTFVPGDKRRKGKLETEQEMPMLEGALTLLCQLLSIRTQLGIYDKLLFQ